MAELTPHQAQYFGPETYDSRQEAFKSPYGAVSSGTQVTLHLRPRREWGFASAQVFVRFEFSPSRNQALPMYDEEGTGDRDCFTCVLSTEDYIGLIWYSFRLMDEDGNFVTSPTYQLTVYDGTDAVPTWFGQGVCYQIFPDRFYRTRIPDPTGLVGNRSVHQDWGEDPISGPIGHTPKGKDICNRDFFGGDLPGVMEKLDYLEALGVETLYFCPIFEASENHRYGTADYSRIDPMLGTNADFSALCAAAHERGMKIILDGVFNHTGFVSRYFNGDGFYPTVGAYQSKSSPYASWFQFKKDGWPEDYECWWGIYSLPAVEEHDPGYRDFIFGGKNSVVRRWLRAGADGWRLDVADELPDDFVAGIHQAVRETNPNAVVIGEVWEDGSNKIAYNTRRKHLLGRHLDGLMNYPFRTAAIEFLLGGEANGFKEEMETLRENYPPFAFYSAMNTLGTHDTLRILTYLGTGTDQVRGGDAHITQAQRALGLRRLRLGAILLFAFPGAPTIYYGDEAGMEGYQDPYNRRTFPWDEINPHLLAWFQKLGHLRKTRPALRSGALSWGPCKGHLLTLYRTGDTERLCALLNAGDRAILVPLEWDAPTATDLLTGKTYPVENGRVILNLPPCSGLLLTDQPEKGEM